MLFTITTHHAGEVVSLNTLLFTITTRHAGEVVSINTLLFTITTCHAGEVVSILISIEEDCWINLCHVRPETIIFFASLLKITQQQQKLIISKLLIMCSRGVTYLLHIEGQLFYMGTMCSRGVTYLLHIEGRLFYMGTMCSRGVTY